MVIVRCDGTVCGCLGEVLQMVGHHVLDDPDLLLDGLVRLHPEMVRQQPVAYPENREAKKG